MSARAAGLLLGFAADRLLGDPRRWHPVAGFGTVAAALERRLHADSRFRGAAYAAGLVGTSAVLGLMVERGARGPLARVAVTAVGTWVVLGGRSLEREAFAVDELLSADDLPAARHRLTHLVGRGTGELDASEVARAVVESVAENTSDAVVAPLVWGSLLGLPGLFAYRAANTLDAMVGHRSPRHERFGWAAARLDDLLNLPGSRLSALVLMASDPAGAQRVWRTWRRDAAGHPSPNAGVVEAAFAGSLGVRLGGTNRYGSRVEHRVVLGDGRPPGPVDIRRATDLARRVGVGAALVTAVAASAIGRRRTR